MSTGSSRRAPTGAAISGVDSTSSFRNRVFLVVPLFTSSPDALYLRVTIIARIVSIARERARSSPHPPAWLPSRHAFPATGGNFCPFSLTTGKRLTLLEADEARSMEEDRFPPRGGVFDSASLPACESPCVFHRRVVSFVFHPARCYCALRNHFLTTGASTEMRQ